MVVGKKSIAVTVLLPAVAGRSDPRDPRAMRAHHPSAVAGLALLSLA